MIATDLLIIGNKKEKQGKEGKLRRVGVGEKRRNLGKKGKNWEGSFTLPR